MDDGYGAYVLNFRLIVGNVKIDLHFIAFMARTK